jgi:hypothetical protein
MKKTVRNIMRAKRKLLEMTIINLDNLSKTIPSLSSLNPLEAFWTS